MHTVNHLGLVLQTKKTEKNSYTKNYFDASDFVSLLCSLQGVIILDELRMLEQTVNFLL
jgi:hypothetical protein